MIFVFWMVLALAVGTFHASRHREGRTTGETAGIFLRWWLIIAVGVGGLVGAGFHIFDGAGTAKDICFTRGDGGFQFENAMGDLSIAVAALLCIWIRHPMWWAALILIFAIQFYGDAYGHIHQMVEYDNHCVDNTGAVLWSDIVVPTVAIILFAVMRRSGPGRAGSA